MHELDTRLEPDQGEFSDLSLAQDLRQLADEAKAVARTELAFQKSRAAYVGAETKTITLLFVIALVIAFFAVMALVVGVVIALGPILGLWGAMAAVTVVLLIAAGLCAFTAMGRLSRMMKIVSNSDKN
ncbi:phage holin family protein [Novosphingobium sp. FGD1]|jgi:uncharacterized membrane protein YqjE|uniref:Phage holin family protein n=1 Tax=Novosphingobium silvae TaxID=2692619 RepID=A0A7X4K6B3_9SPHN|nr:phage holin family protein [Novosphingobium silvae]MYL96742.1 phage holin family protein [Novosphingobium silvae]